MSSSSYQIAWLVYLFAAAGMIFVIWRASWRWPRVLRHLLCAFSIGLLLTPYASDADKQLFAPAFLTSVFELCFGDPQQALNSSKPLVAVLLVCLLLSLAFSFTRRKKRP